MKKTVIFGASPAAVLCYSELTRDSPYEVAAFTIDRSYIREQELYRLPVVPFEDIESIYPILLRFLKNPVRRLRNIF